MIRDAVAGFDLRSVELRTAKKLPSTAIPGLSTSLLCRVFLAEDGNDGIMYNPFYPGGGPCNVFWRRSLKWPAGCIAIIWTRTVMIGLWRNLDIGRIEENDQ